MAQVMSQVRRVATREVVHNRASRRVIAMVSFALLTAIGAHVAFPLAGTPVPVTLQTFFVTLAGVLLGPYLGAGAMVMYLAAGVAGAPMFSYGAGFAHLLGPTGGYLLAFPLAAAVSGVLAQPDRAGARAGFLRIALAMFLGTVVILALGAAQLAMITGDAGRAVQAGVLPFLIGDLIKVVAAALVALRLRTRTLELL